ncbi:MAG: leucine-rich repeat domain-containing protein [Clostridia bacterium]|nr:leucine-rich repeat domain-containing protein [Clostridia bacterium]
MKKYFYSFVSVTLTLAIVFGSALFVTGSAADDAIVEDVVSSNVSDNALDASGNCGTNVFWSFNSESGVLTLVGTGATANYEWNSSPFYNNKAIKSIVIGKGITVVGDNLFSSCTKLTSVSIPDSVVRIGNGAFRRCLSLETILLPSSVKEIFEKAFDGCCALINVNIPDGIESISDSAFNGTAIYDDGTNWDGDVFYVGKALIKANDTIGNSYSVKDGTTIIADNAFKKCKSLKGISIPSSVKALGESAFSDCESLSDVNSFSQNVTVLNDNVFSNCKSLQAIVIPDTVTTIGDSAFSGCSAAKFILLGKGVKQIGEKAFEGCTGTTDIIIPDNVISADNNSFKGCAFKNVVMGKGLTFIPNSLIDSEALTTVVIGDGVVSIDNRAFVYCTLLSSLTIGNSVKRIGDYAFRGCSSLKSLTIPDSVTTVGKSAFTDCPLTTVTMGSGLTSIPGTLINQKTLETFVIGSKVRSIDKNTFKDCSSLKYVTIPVSVKEIGLRAFYNCKALTKVTYSGKCSDWNSVKVAADNECLFNVFNPGHVLTNSKTVAATCTEKGYTTSKCSVCGAEYRNKYVDELGHKPGEWVVTKKPTATRQGIKRQYCTVCKKLIKSESIPATSNDNPFLVGLFVIFVKIVITLFALIKAQS